MRTKRHTAPFRALAWLPIAAVALGGGLAMPAAAADESDSDHASGGFSAETFQSPSNSSMPAVYWYWGGTITDQLITEQMKQLRDKGIYEVVLFSFNGADMEPTFGSEAWFDRVEHTLREAQDHDMKVWLFNDNNFPSGRGATLVTDGGTMGDRTWEGSDEHRLKGLWRSTSVVSGGETVSLTESTGVSTEDGRLAVDGQVLDGSAPLAIGEDWADYTLSATDVRFAGESGGIMVRASEDGRDGYLWEIDARGVSTISRVDDGERTMLGQSDAIPGFNYQRPRELAVTADGGTISIQIDGRETGALTVTDDTYSTGTIAPYNTNADRTLWGEIAVAADDGDELWAADFEDSTELADFVSTMSLEQAPSAAVATNIDSGEQVELTGESEWNTQDGRWRLDLFGAMTLKSDASGYVRGYLDLLSEDATRAFLDTVPQEYYDRFEWAMGTVVPGFWDDEPFIASANPHPFKRHPWSPELAAEIERLGGDPGKVFVASYETSGRAGEIDRGIYWEAVSNLFAESYYKVQSEWMEERGLKFISNPLLDEESPSARLNNTADLTKNNQWAQVPGTDMITGDYQLGEQSTLVRNAASTAHQQGKERVVLETFGNSGWQVAPEFMHATTGALATRGANQTFLHALWTDEKRVIFAPPFGPRSTFWHEMTPMDEWIGRVSEIARATDAADTALIQPQDAAQQGKDLEVGTDEESGDPIIAGRESDKQFNEAGFALERSQVDFDYVTDGALSGDDALLLHAEAVDGQLVVGEASYSHAVLPETATIDVEAIETLSAFVQSGGELVVVGDVPEYEAHGDDEALAAALTELVPADGESRDVDDGTVLHVASYEDAGAAAAELGASAVTASPAAPSLRVSRKVAGNDIAFLMNNESGESVSTTLEFPVAGVPEAWDPADGSTDRVLNYVEGETKTSVPITLDAYETIAVVFPDENEHGAHLTASDLDADSIEVDGDTMTVDAIADASGEYAFTGTDDGREFTGTASVTDELAELPIEGAWQFEFLPDQSPSEGSPSAEVGDGLQIGEQAELEPGTSWTTLNPTFSGTGRYTTNVELEAADLENRRLLLDLGDVSDIADVTINGTEFPAALWSPYTVDVTDALVSGSNEIEIEVTNTLANERKNALDSGLMSNVVLQPRAVVTAELAASPGDDGSDDGATDGGTSDGATDGDATDGSDGTDTGTDGATDGGTSDGATDGDATDGSDGTDTGTDGATDGGDASGDDNLAVTGGTVALGAVVLAVMLLAAGALLVSRRRRATAGGDDDIV